MHKSYYSVLPCQNKLLQMKWDRDQYNKHQKKLREVRSVVDSKAPQTYIHLHLKPKKLQLEEERIAIIERDNRILLEKMSYIMRTRGSIDNMNNYEPKSLNRDRRQRELLKVTRENKAMMERILRKGGGDGQLQWARDWTRTLTYMDNISRYPKNWWLSDAKDERGNSQSSRRRQNNSTEGTRDHPSREERRDSNEMM